MQIARCQLWRIASIEALLSCAALAVSHFVDERIAPAPLELRKISVGQHNTLSVLACRICRCFPTGFRGDTRDGRKLRERIARIVLTPRYNVVAVKPIPAPLQDWIGSVPGLVVLIQIAVSSDVVV